MNTMHFIVWMLPIIFMLHDFEEIIMVEVWGKRYQKEINSTWTKKQPFGLNYIQNYHTSTFSIGVEVLFLLFSSISFLSVIFQNYFLWYGAFLGITLHLIFIHMLVCIKFKHYVPGVMTAFVFLMPSIWFLHKAQEILHYSIGTIFLAGLLGTILTLTLLPILHKGMETWSKGLYNYSRK